MPEGGTVNVNAMNVTVSSTMNLPIKDGEYIKIEISDTGIGINTKNISKIFDPYFTTKSNGSGLGLATSYSIINKHSGYISVESNQGDGTIFTIYLPRSKNEVGEGNTDQDKIICGKGNVLIMDDDEVIRELEGEMLKSIGYDVAFAKEGKEALDLYLKAMNSGEPFDAVIIDLTVPGGMGARESIQKFNEIDSKAKCIVASGYVNDAVMIDYDLYGFSGSISKPFEMVQLSNLLHNIINQKD
jgi:CheY-like chemotaxis protein